MCGIVGYIGKRQALPILLEGLKRLEYRGYDSAGVGILAPEIIQIVKEKGKVENLELRLRGKHISGNIGIAHTRWATHGIPSVVNAHPQIDCLGDIALVHNGIVENLFAVTRYVQDHHEPIIRSSTDTEILAHLIESQAGNSFEEAFFDALAVIKGTYGIALVTLHEPDKIFCARQGSPLVIGIGQKEYFIASDPVAFANYTDDVVYLNDGEVAIITKQGYKVKTISKKVVKKKVEKLDSDLGKIEKGGYEHFMLKEIHEQPDSVQDCTRGRLLADEGKVRLGGLEFVEDGLRKASRITITACGTSYYTALIGKRMIEQYAHIPVSVEYASEYQFSHTIIDKNEYVIVISQSGETTDTLGALNRAQALGATGIGIVNVVGSTIARATDAGVYIHAGPEIGVASTKAFTSQITALALITLLIAQENGMAKKKKDEIIGALVALPDNIRKVLALELQIKKLAKKFKRSKNFLYLGRGYQFPAAMEGALKLKEISYIHAEGLPAAEMKHGPIALIDKKMPVVVIAVQGYLYDKVVSNIQEVKARGGIVIAIVSEGDNKLDSLVDYTISVPTTIDMLMPILTVIPLQLLAYHIAVLLDRDIDQPRNLAKSVTVP